MALLDANGNVVSAASPISSSSIQHDATCGNVIGCTEATDAGENGSEYDSGDSLCRTASNAVESVLSDWTDDSLRGPAPSTISDASSGGADSTMVFIHGNGKARGSGFVLLDSGSSFSLIARSVAEKHGHGAPWRNDGYLPYVRGFAAKSKHFLGYIWLVFRTNHSKKVFRTKFFVVEDADISSSTGVRDWDALLSDKVSKRVTEHGVMDAGQLNGTHVPERAFAIGSRL